MGHAHHHAPSNYNRAFAIGISLNVLFVLIEVYYGLVAHSMALLADAGHNLGDVLGLIIAWGATILTLRKPTTQHTYGWRRSSILAALLNSLILMLAIGAIAWESIQRLSQPVATEGLTVIIVALLGAAINTATALLFMKDSGHDLNIRGAYLHMAADAAVSFGVALGGVVMLFTAWFWLDSVISLLIVGVIMISTWQLFRQSLDLAMDAVPDHVDLPAVKSYLQNLPEIKEVHDLHIWAMSTTETALTAHLVHCVSPLDDQLTRAISHELQHRFQIQHTTLQFETDANLCQGGCESPAV